MKNLALVLILSVVMTTAARADQMQMVRITVVPTDLSGNPIISIASGQQFHLEAIVQDIRNPASFPGVFAAYLDVAYNPNLASIATNAPFAFGAFFPIEQSSDTTTPGQILGAGAATTSPTPPGNSPQLLWTVSVTAGAAGMVTFTPSFDTMQGHDVLEYGNDFPVTADQIAFVGSTLNVVPEPSSISLATFGLIALAAWGWQRKQ